MIVKTLYIKTCWMGTQVEDGGGSWISGFWAAGSFRAAADVEGFHYHSVPSIY